MAADPRYGLGSCWLAAARLRIRTLGGPAGSGRSLVDHFRYTRPLFRYIQPEVAVGRADGARAWARVLSELAGVPVTVEWERPAWRVYWTDGPTRQVLMDRAAALGRYRVGAPLGFERLRFVRSSSALAVALGWLARGSPESPAKAGEARGGGLV